MKEYTREQVIQAQEDINYMMEALKEVYGVEKLWVHREDEIMKLRSPDQHHWRWDVGDTYSSPNNYLMMRHEFLASACAMRITDPSFILPKHIEAIQSFSLGWLKYAIAVPTGAGIYELFSWIF